VDPANFSDETNATNEAIRLETFTFAAHLQAKYPFVFEPGTRGVSGDMNRRKQERLLTHFILRSIISSDPLPDSSKPAALRLAAMIVKQIGPGGANFAPREFNPAEKKLARDLGVAAATTLLGRSLEIGNRFGATLRPVNSAEHTISWSLRYTGQLLKAVVWESKTP
jgi:hypothetical protein